MLQYVVRRILLMIPTLFVISLLVYLIIDLPPGDCVTAQIDELLSRGDPDALNRAEELRHLYGLDQSLMHRYFTWFFGIFHWDFGLSCQDTVPVKDLIGERIVLTMVMESATIAFICAPCVSFGCEPRAPLLNFWSCATRYHGSCCQSAGAPSALLPLAVAP